MTTQIDYEAIARENGYYVQVSTDGTMFRWCDSEGDSTKCFKTPEDAYKACCVENNLVEGEE